MTSDPHYPAGVKRLIQFKLDGHPWRTVEVDAYIEAKTKQMREFGYTNLTEKEVADQVEAVLAGKEIGDGLNVIGEFIKDEIKAV